MIALSLLAVSAMWGWLTWWVFRRFVNHNALRTVGKRIHARLLEIRLYAEEPGLVWHAQSALIADNGRFIAAVARPVFLLAIGFALLYAPLDSVFGGAPLIVGQTAIVTVHLPRDLHDEDATATLRVPQGISVETSPVRDYADRQISWQIVATSQAEGSLTVDIPGETRSSAPVFVGATKLRYPDLFHPPTWVEVGYSRATIAFAGLRLSWLAWFVITSTLVAAGLTALARGPRPVSGV